jgi:hypothetical protein
MYRYMLMVLAAGLAMSAGGAWFVTRDSAEAAACEQIILGSLVSPSSYSRVEAIERREETDVVIRMAFDADNGYGASLRGHAGCRFGPNLTFRSAQINGEQVSADLAEAIIGNWRLR